MTWVAWRQFRTQALTTFGLLAAFAVLVIVTGLHLRDLYGSLGGTHCSPHEACTAPPLTGVDTSLNALLGPALLVIPALLGMFWGAPLVARELESGTYRLAWTQSVTRRRCLATKIALVGAAALAIAGLASWLVSWWFAPLDAVNLNSFDPAVFTARGIVAIGYAGFAFALGVTTGALARRTLPAMATTLLGFIAVRLVFTEWIRPHLLAPAHVLIPLTQGQDVGFLAQPSPTGPTNLHLVAGLPMIPNAWPISATLVDRSNHALTTAQLHAALVNYCPTIARGLPQNPGAGVTKNGTGLTGGVFQSCLNALSHHLQLLVAYQPPSHYWPLQALETAIFLAAALALVGVTAWRVRPRHSTQSSPAELAPASAEGNTLHPT